MYEARLDARSSTSAPLRNRPAHLFNCTVMQVSLPPGSIELRSNGRQHEKTPLGTNCLLRLRPPAMRRHRPQAPPGFPTSARS